MRIPTLQTEQRILGIPINSLVNLRRKKGFGIQCTSGMVLLTIKHQLRDIELRPSDVYLVRSDGLMLIESVGDANVT